MKVDFLPGHSQGRRHHHPCSSGSPNQLQSKRGDLVFKILGPEFSFKPTNSDVLLFSALSTELVRLLFPLNWDLKSQFFKKLTFFIKISMYYLCQKNLFKV